MGVGTLSGEALCPPDSPLAFLPFSLQQVAPSSVSISERMLLWNRRFMLGFRTCVFSVFECLHLEAVVMCLRLYHRLFLVSTTRGSLGRISSTLGGRGSVFPRLVPFGDTRPRCVPLFRRFCIIFGVLYAVFSTVFSTGLLVSGLFGPIRFRL